MTCFLRSFSTNYVLPALNSITPTIIQSNSSITKIYIGSCAVTTGCCALVKSRIFDRIANVWQKKPESEVKPVHKTLATIGGLSVAGGLALIVSGVWDLCIPSNSKTNQDDFCQMRSHFCEGNIGIPRKNMPQLDTETTKQFIQDLNKQGLVVEYTQMPVTEIVATQNELYAPKVMQIYNNPNPHPCQQEIPYVISADHHVLDGHHRWAAGRLLHEEGETCSLNVVKVNLPIKELYDKAMQYPGVTTSDLNQF